MDMDAAKTQLLISTKMEKFADIASTPASLFRFAEDTISHEHNITTSASPADPWTEDMRTLSSDMVVDPRTADRRTPSVDIDTVSRPRTEDPRTLSSDMVVDARTADRHTVLSRTPFSDTDADPRTDPIVANTRDFAILPHYRSRIHAPSPRIRT